jgi:hypothetical protein
MLKRTTTMAALLLAGAAAPAVADDQAEREGRQDAGSGAVLAAADPAARRAALERLGGSGLLLVVESSNDRVLALDPATGDVIDENFIGPDLPNLGTPINAILNATGNQVLVSNQLFSVDGDVVQAYDLATGDYVGIFAPSNGQNNAVADNIRGIELRENGNLLLSIGSGGNINSIPQFGTDGVFVDQFISAGSGGLVSPFDVFRVPTAAAPLAAGDYLVSSSSGGAIGRYDSTGAFIGQFATAGTFAQQIKQAANGNILVASFTASSEGIYEFTPAGVPVATYDPPGLGGYRGVHELGNGNLLVTNGAGIHEITRGNVLVRTVVAGVSGRYIEAVQASAGSDVIFADGFELPAQPSCAWNTTLGTPGGSIGSLGLWNDQLYIGASQAGSFGGVPGGVQRVDLGTNTVLPLATTELVDGFVTTFVPFNAGTGEKLYMVGAFNGVRFGGAELPDSRGVVAWDGSTTTTVPGSPFAAPLVFGQAGKAWGDVLALGGSGGAVSPPQKPVLALWDGTNWETYREEFEGTVAPVILALETYQGDLYMGGRFARIRLPDGAGGQVTTESVNVMGFDGTAFFSVGGGVIRGTSVVSQVLALKAFDNGDGEALYIGGRFDQSVTGTPLFSVAKWDGSTLSAVGDGFPTPIDVRGFEVHDDGTGPALFVTGTFTATTGGTPIRRLAKLVNSTWIEVAGGTGATPARGQSLPDGRMAVGGSFTEVGVVGTVPGSGPASGLAVLDCTPPAAD